MNGLNYDAFCRLALDKFQHVILKHIEIHNFPHERYIKVILRYFIDDYDVVFEKKYTDEDKNIFDADSKIVMAHVNEVYYDNQFGGQQ